VSRIPNPRRPRCLTMAAPASAVTIMPAEGGGLAPGQPMECASEGAAVRRAEVMSRHEANAGAIAFSRRGDPNMGDFEDAVILKSFGEVPEDFRRA
jgi:hypothetical protein